MQVPARQENASIENWLGEVNQAALARPQIRSLTVHVKHCEEREESNH
jgi:hypothetical protein